MKITYKNCGILFIRAMVTCVALVYLVYKINLRDVIGVLQNLDFGYYLIIPMIMVFVVALHAIRFLSFMDVNLTTTAFWKSWNAISLGNFFNLVMPFRGGDFIRAGYLKTSFSQTPFSKFIGFLLLEKTFELGSFASFLLVMYFIGISYWVLAIIVIALGVLVYEFLVKWVSKPNNETVNSVWFSKIKSLTYSVFDGFLRVLNRIQKIQIIGISFILRLLEAAMLLMIAKSIGLDLGYSQVLFAHCIIFMGLMIPGAPAYVGTYHAISILALSVFDVPDQQAVSFAVLSHLWLVITSAAFGIVSMFLTSMSFKDVSDVADHEG